MKKIDLGGRHAVVTGAAQGIGFATATRLLDSGAAVAIWDQDVDLMRQAAQSLAGASRYLADSIQALTSTPRPVEACATTTSWPASCQRSVGSM